MTHAIRRSDQHNSVAGVIAAAQVSKCDDVRARSGSTR
jgi:hypothetical protein